MNPPVIHSCIVALDLQRRLGGHGLEDEVVIAMGAVLVARVRPVSIVPSARRTQRVVKVPLLKLGGVLAETLLALLARKHLSHSSDVVTLKTGTADNTISADFCSACDSCSWWHSAQSNHFLPEG